MGLDVEYVHGWFWHIVHPHASVGICVSLAKTKDK